MQGYGDSCVRILVNNFLHSGQKVFKALERLEIGVF